MFIDLTNPFVVIVSILAGSLVLVGIGYFFKGVYVDARVEADRKIQAAREARELERNRLGRRGP